MEYFKKKLDTLTISALVVLAISVSLLDFGDLSWSTNIKGYVGLIVFAVLILMKVFFKYDTERSK